MSEMPSNFKEWACSLSGCSGGNPHAATWLCGIEPSGGGENREKLKNEIQCGRVDEGDEVHNWKIETRHRFGKNVAKLYAAIEGNNVDSYPQLIDHVWDGSELFKLNLFPIAFNSTKSTLWEKHGLAEITGFTEKRLFQTWCILNRFPEFAKLAADKKPKLIIGTGITYLQEYFLCFSGDKDLSARIKTDEIRPESQTNKPNPRRYYWVQLNKSTTLVVIPFITNPYGLNSNYLLQEMGKRISRLMA